MTARKTRVTEEVATEDAFGTPPAARSGMMKVAGATDDDDPGRELITDEEDLLRELVRSMIRSKK